MHWESYRNLLEGNQTVEWFLHNKHSITGQYVLGRCLGAFLCMSSINSTLTSKEQCCLRARHVYQPSKKLWQANMFQKWASVVQPRICVPQTAAEPTAMLMQVHKHSLFSLIIFFFSDACIPYSVPISFCQLWMQQRIQVQKHPMHNKNPLDPRISNRKISTAISAHSIFLIWRTNCLASHTSYSYC